MRVRSSAVAALVAAILLPGLTEAQSTQRPTRQGEKKSAAEAIAAAWLLPDTRATPGASELAKRFPGAEAVVVLDAVQHEWAVDRQVSTLQRRVRLIEAGSTMELYFPEGLGPWTVRSGSARVVDGSGAERSLEAPSAKAVDGGLLVSVDASSAGAGELVELVQVFECAHPSHPPWTVGAEQPVLESRVVALPPPILTLRAYGFGLPEGGLEPLEIVKGEAKGAVWRFTDLPALADAPLSPPREQVSPRLFLAVEKYPDLGTGELKELTWPTWGALSALAADTWTAPFPVEALAKELLPEEASPAELLAALQGRLRVTRKASWPEKASSKEAIERGEGNSADLALVLAGVLQARGLEKVDLVFARPADRGPLVDAAPADGNFTELLVRVGELWLDPAPGGGAGTLPPRFHGGAHARLGESLEGPTSVPPATSLDNRLERTAKLRLSPDGRLSGTATWNLSPFAAALARDEGVEFERDVDREAWASREGDAMSYGVLPWRLFQDLDLSGAPPPGLIDLGRPRLVVDEITVLLPEGVTGAKLVSAANIDAGPAGGYERKVEPDGHSVTVTRTLRLEITRFGPDEAEALFAWLRRIQEAEGAVTRLQFAGSPPPQP